MDHDLEFVAQLRYVLETDAVAPSHVLDVLGDGQMYRRQILGVMVSPTWSTDVQSRRVAQLDLVLRDMVEDGRLEKGGWGLYRRKR